MNDDNRPDWLQTLLESTREPLPDFTEDELRRARDLMRLVKAGRLASLHVELHRRDGVLLMKAKKPSVSYKCR